jgi:hypothetical protein
MKHFWILMMIISNIFCNFGFSQSDVLAKITINAAEHERLDTPVSISLDELSISGAISLREIKEESKEIVPVQIDSIENRLYWILSGKTDKGTIRVYELFSDKAKKNTEVEVADNDKGIEIKYHNKILLQYNSFPVELPEGVDSTYSRGAFIHPLKTLSGKVLSRIQPEDHYHHVGIWNPWTKTSFEGREIDFWNLVKKQGTVRFKNYVSKENGNIYGGFGVNHEHIDLTSPEGEKVAINEIWFVKVYKPDDKPWYILDFTSVLQCASASPITLMKYRYGGGIGFRATEDWNKNNCEVITSEGKTRLDGDATRAKWCNVFGTVDKLSSGILFMCNPENFSFPQPMRIWPENANSGNGDMYFQFCPIRENDWHLEPAKQYFQKYRLIVYDGEISEKEAEQMWMDYSNPPEIIINKPKK